MQNNKPNSFRRFIRNNGYYLIIGACVAAIGISGFFLLRGSDEPAEDEMLSVPVTVETDEGKEPSVKDSAAETEKTEDVISDQPEEEPIQSTDNLQPEETEPTVRVILNPVSGETLAAYSVSALSYNETTRDWRTHAGIDLAAEPDAPVCATEDGTVIAIYSDDYFGTTVEISHASGYTTIYSNLNEATAVSVGQSVRAGDCIGTVGNTALLEVNQASHLHFAVTYDGVTLDPADYLS